MKGVPMPRLLSLALGCLTLMVSTGCSRGSRKAETYANETRAVLKSYQDEVNRKISAEQASYRYFSAVTIDTRRQNTLELLFQDRLERSERLADDILELHAEKKNIARSRVKAQLTEYALHDFTKMRDLIEGETAERTRLSGQLVAFELDAKRLEELSSALETLGQPRSRTQQFKQLIEFGEKFKTELNRLGCEDLKAEAKQLEAEIAQLDARIAKLEAEGKNADNLKARKKSLGDRLNRVKELLKARNCP